MMLVKGLVMGYGRRFLFAMGQAVLIRLMSFLKSACAVQP